jgi:isopenicillin N synthase-like dioxygenase
MATAVQAPSAVPTHLPKAYSQVPESRYELDWADLVTLDLSKFDQSGGKEQLAAQLRDAVHNVGFFYITNFGLSQEEVDEQFAIGRDIFELPMEEKLKYRADLGRGHYSGYRPLGAAEIVPGIKDNVEMYNVFKFIPELERTQPQIVLDNRQSIEKFQRHIAEDTIQKLLVLISLGLELPEDYLSQGHRYNDISECHLRYMIYRARTPEENEKCGRLYSKGHTDFGSLTLLFRQPVAAFQVKMPDGTWKWVKPYPESVTVNIADVLQFWTNGYLKSSVHRVVTPPDDQAHIDRLGLLYFLRPAYDLELKTIDSPVLKRLGLVTGKDEAAGIKAGDWVRARVKGNFDKPEVRNQKGGREVIGGVKMGYYD